VKADVGRIHWGRVLLAGALAAGLSVALVVAVYAAAATSWNDGARSNGQQHVQRKRVAFGVVACDCRDVPAAS
jgi:hypothetical protein